MSQLVVDGLYENGVIVLGGRPRGVKRARVRVRFLPDDQPIASTEQKAADRRDAIKRMLETMQAGIDFGGERFNRDEIYEDRMTELDAHMNRH
jgi:hypothetical protein